MIHEIPSSATVVRFQGRCFNTADLPARLSPARIPLGSVLVHRTNGAFLLSQVATGRALLLNVDTGNRWCDTGIPVAPGTLAVLASDIPEGFLNEIHPDAASYFAPRLTRDKEA